MARSPSAWLASVRERLKGTKLSGASPLGHVGYWTAGAAILTMGAALFLSTTNIREATARVEQTMSVLENISGVKANIGRAESAQRGFLLYREERFRRERDETIDETRIQVEELARLAAARGALERERVARLRDLVQERIAVMTETENIPAGSEAAVATGGRAQRLSARIYQALEQMRAEELRALSARRNEQELAYDRTVSVLIGAIAIVIAVMIPGYVGFVREARARVDAERRMTSLADTLPGALVQYRMWPDGRAQYEFLSEGAEHLRGIDRDAALRDPEVVLGTILEEDRGPFLAALAHHGKSLRRLQHDYRVRGPGGDLRWMRTSAAPRALPDGSVRWSAYWSDVTEERHLERELREAKEAAESANRAKSTFLATMSHEIRTPMNGVLGMLELLALTDLNPEQRTTLQVVRESGRSLQRIIDDILDFSKIEAGKLDLRPEVTSVADIVERVRNIYAGNASSKGLVLKRNVDPRISPAVVVDPLRLQQILNNLVSNAIKFTSQGEVELRADLVSRLDGEDLVRFTVSDTGVGITAEEQATLFQPFSQAAGSRATGGTGLGLSISQRLAQMMGGFIMMESEHGRGTTVTLTVPMPIAEPRPALVRVENGREAADAARGRRLAPSPQQAEKEGTLVLIADDHPINRMVLFKQVNALGYAVESAENGLEALDLWSTGRFAVVITDVNMPEMDGYQLTASIRDCERRHGHKRTPIIACTANALGGEAEKCLAAGMDDYLPKPIDLGQLAEKLDYWLPLGDARGVTKAVALAQKSGASSPLDGEVLSQVAGGDLAVERDILARFRQFNAEDVIHLTNAADKWDLRYLQQAAHRIKGAARTIGAQDLAAACERVEHASHEGDLAAARGAMPALVDELQRLDAYLVSLDLPRVAPAPKGNSLRGAA